MWFGKGNEVVSENCRTKQFLKILVINIVVLFLLYILLELFAMCILACKYHESLSKFSDFYKSMTIIKMDDKHLYRPIIPAKNNKDGSIVVFGCSFADGSRLSNKDNITGHLADITGRECINRGLPGQGVQTMYWQLSEGRIKKNFPNVKYFIYVYIDDHIHNRILKFRCFPFMYSVSMKYRINNNKLEIIKPTLWRKYSFIYRFLEDLESIIVPLNKKKELFYKIIQDSYSIMKKDYPDSKFIILEYPCSFERVLDKKKIENMGISVYSANELANDDLYLGEYHYSKDDSHPNKKAWDLVVPALVKAEGM